MTSEIKDLRIAIIGAGMGGLTTALALAKEGFTNIQVYEYARDLGFVGAGIQLAPNMARVLDKLGVWKNIESEATWIQETSIRKGHTGEELGLVKLEHVQAMYGYKHMVGHRANLAGSIYEGCKQESAIKFNFGTHVQQIHAFGPRPKFTAVSRTDENGTPFDVEADVLFGADGVKSNTRTAILKELNVDAEVEDSGQAAYRIMLHRDLMERDPELKELIDSDRVTRWVGTKRHIIAYPVANKTIYNISTAHPDDNFAAAPSASYTTKGSKPVMQSVYAEFCPLVQKMLDLVPDGEVCEWRLRVHAPLPTWVHGSTALLGDACHPTLPHMNQGAAQAIEDAASIGVAFSKLPDTKPESITKALKVYERVRKQRAEALVAMAAANGKAMQLGEGAAQEERDRQFAAVKAGKKGPVPDKWADADVQKMIYGFDCQQQTADHFEEYFSAA